MQRLGLAGHYGATVELDVCSGCDLVWFDGTETARLNGPGLLELIGLMAASYDLPHQPLSAATRCPRCAGPLKTVHNQSRWGRSVQLQCVKRDGAYQSFAEFLEEKGLLRPMSRLDRAKLLHDRGRIDCVNCGAANGWPAWRRRRDSAGGTASRSSGRPGSSAGRSWPASRR